MEVKETMSECHFICHSLPQMLDKVVVFFFVFLFFSKIHFKQMVGRSVPKHKRQFTTWQFFLPSREEISHSGMIRQPLP
jgi:hypothetical protein